MTRRVRLLTVLLLVFGALPILTAASSGGNGAEARAEHQRIVDFWTHQRVAQARPRDFVRSPGGGFVPGAARPGTGGVVSGVSWNGGGVVDGTTGKVLFAMDGSYWVCSASTVTDSTSDRTVVLTAGHCLYDEVKTEFATNWTFIPDYDAAPAPLSTSSSSYCNDTLHGCWTAQSLAVHNGYATAGGFNDTAVLYDWGFAALGLGGHDLTHADAEVGAQGIVFAKQAFDSTAEHAFGYPAAGKYKGNDLVYCKNSVDGDPYNSNDTYRMNGCKMTGGSSGGPWMFGFNELTGVGTLFSVNSYGYSGVSAMHGPFFNAATAATFAAARTVAAGTSVVVGP